MDEQIGAGAVFNDIVIAAGVARDHGDAPAIFDAIAAGRLDHVAVVDLERNRQILRRTHWRIFIPESLTTFSQ